MNDKRKVLVVDDDPALLKMTVELLRDHYAVSCVKSGMEALRLLSTDYTPDLILLDVDMPKLSGFDTLTALRRQDGAEEIPVMFLTGVTHSGAELEGFSCGAVDYIAKPFVAEILLARIKVHLENAVRLHKLKAQGGDGEAGNGIDEEKLSRLSADLSDTERKIMRLIALGYTNQEIGEELNYSYNYVKKVVGVIYEKKGVSKRSALKKMLI